VSAGDVEDAKLCEDLPNGMLLLADLDTTVATCDNDHNVICLIDQECLDAGVGGLCGEIPNANPGGAVTCASSIPTPEDCGPLPECLVDSPETDPFPCRTLEIVSPFDGYPVVAYKKAGDFNENLRVLCCDQEVDPPAWFDCTISNSAVAEFPDPTRTKGGGKKWSAAKVRCADFDPDNESCEPAACIPVAGTCIDDQSCLVDADCAVGECAEVMCNGLDDDCDGIIDDGFVNPFPPEILVKATVHTVGLGASPGVTKDPLKEIRVCAYDKSAESCARKPLTEGGCGGISHREYQCIVDNCDNRLGRGDCCTTDKNGECFLTPPPGDYVLISADATKTALPDPLGVNASALACGQVMQKNLLQIVKVNTGDGAITKLPAKSMRRTGSELLIIEPEFVVWDGTTQLYPFLFESVGAWEVTAGVTPPEGFVSDYDSLVATVDGELGAVQFSITETGSDLMPTETMFEVKHNGHSEMIPSKVDIKLTRGYAKKMKHRIKILEKAGLIYELKEGGDEPGVCEATENPEVTCNDKVDNDCDGSTDLKDTDCTGGSCTDAPLGDSCRRDSDCCSNTCKGKKNKVCM
jgi:hypothetical protein